jgi:hypothetical protein
MPGRAYITKCRECRRRKVKCSAEQPFCRRCFESGIACTGYDKPKLEFVYVEAPVSKLEALVYVSYWLPEIQPAGMLITGRASLPARQAGRPSGVDLQNQKLGRRLFRIKQSRSVIKASLVCSELLLLASRHRGAPSLGCRVWPS